ncbi:MAG TPA: polysaccharide deacetylase family protein [Pyrinomonadaceae bacterium]|nr:polysaccharide deacetylase family protein [Pyrinomonadaceae bacterium]
MKAIRAVALMYHDVVDDSNAYDESGFPGSDAARYKLSRKQFENHLEAIGNNSATRPELISEVLVSAVSLKPTLLTFDDGGVSAYSCIADMLELRGWYGHFFVTASRIDKAGFLSRKQIRELHSRGHIIGSHSFSHPERMSHCSPEEIGREWKESIALLSDITGSETTTASVPGGSHSRRVAEKAAEAGIRVLFTSEPITRTNLVDGCLVLGRYTIQRSMPPRVAAALAAGKLAPHVRQLLLWNLKKAAKIAGGKKYLRLRRSLLQKS